jgi:integrase
MFTRSSIATARAATICAALASPSAFPCPAEFMDAYDAGMADAAPKLEIGASRTKPGSLQAFAVSYFNSASFQSMAPRTQRVYRNIIDRLCAEHGDKRGALLRREHVVKLMAARADKPESANMIRKALRAVMRHAVDIGLRPDDPTRDVRSIRTKSDGFHSWTDSEIEQFEARHPIGTRARLAFALLLYTGQRRGDVVRMGRQHVRDGVLTVRQEKTSAELAIPVHPALASIIADMPRDHLTFLTTQFGQPFTSPGFGNWFRERCNEAELPRCSAHGLRKAAARRLAEAGCTEHEIASITGHRSLKEIVRYTRAADQKKLATSAMDKVKTRTSIGKLVP